MPTHAAPTRRLALAMAWVAVASPAAPVWKAPPLLKLGELHVLELREEDPAAPALPRPTVEDRLGPLWLRATEPLADGRGWRFQVQALEPGLVAVPPLDLGDGRRSPELRVQVLRTIPFGGPWMGLGGGRDDRLPPTPFPWAWASLLLLPPLALAAGLFRAWRKGSSRRHRHQATHAFLKLWPPATRERPTLDAAHASGRDLLVARFGEGARAWGAPEFRERQLLAWVQWAQSLDAARFGRTEPAFPTSADLLAALEHPGRAGGAP